MRSRDYNWWIQRLRWATQACDYIRLDHFRGFEQFWEIPASEPTAINGRWADGPKDDFFNRSEEHTSELQSRSDLVCRLLLEKQSHRPGCADLVGGAGPGATRPR